MHKKMFFIWDVKNLRISYKRFNTLLFVIYTGDLMARNSREYFKIIMALQKLDVDEQIEMLEELLTILKYRKSDRKHSIMELRGLGKEIWSDVDVESYINQERDSWDS